MRSTSKLLRTLTLAACTVVPSLAAAQNAPAAPPGNAGGDDNGTPAPTGPSVTVVQVPAAPTYPGTLPPAGFNPDAHLPQGSRSTTDASHTLVTGWNDSSDLTPAVTSLPVPEPSPLALFGLGLAAIAFAARKRRVDR